MTYSPKQVFWGSVKLNAKNLNLPDRLFICMALVGTLMWAFPHISYASTLESAPLIFEVNNFSITTPRENYLSSFLAQDIVPKLPDPRTEPLRQYLLSKNSVMATEVETLLEQYHYRLILGIAFAESNFCKYQIMPNNCWGIGGSYPEKYPTLADGVIRANNLIQKYQDLGMTTPKLMRNTWVGWPNDNWIIAVEQITSELEDWKI